MPSISIVTVSYNSSAVIRDTLISIGRQTHIDYEHIVVDMGSTDDTLKIVASYPHVAKVVCLQKGGHYEALNAGIAYATCEIVGILNAGDFYAHNTVLDRISTAFKDPEVLSLYSDIQYVQTEKITHILRHWKSGEYNAQNFFYGWMPPHDTFFVRRELYAECGHFDTRLSRAADYELLLRFLVRYNVSSFYLPEVIIKKRTVSIGLNSLKEKWKANREDRKAWDLNGLTPYFFTIPLKPFRKLSQFFIKN